MTDEILLTVTEIVDDSTGGYTVGELDFGVRDRAYRFIKRSPEHRERLAAWLEWLASAVRTGEAPFSLAGKP